MDMWAGGAGWHSRGGRASHAFAQKNFSTRPRNAAGVRPRALPQLLPFLGLVAVIVCVEVAPSPAYVSAVASDALSTRHRVAFLFPFDAAIFPSTREVVEMAVAHVNENMSNAFAVPGTRLEPILYDTTYSPQPGPIESRAAMFLHAADATTVRSNVTCLIGGISTDTTSMMAMIAQAQDVAALGLFATGDSLSNQALYGTLTRMLPSVKYQSHAVLQLCQAVGWARVALLRWDAGADHVAHDVAQAFGDEFIARAAEHGVEIPVAERFSTSSVAQVLQRIKQADVRVVVYAAEDTPLGAVLGTARSMGMLDTKKYVWLTSQSILYLGTLPFVPQALKELMHGMIAPQVYVEEDEPQLQGDLRQVWEEHILPRTSWVSSGRPASLVRPAPLDAIVTVAKAIGHWQRAYLADNTSEVSLTDCIRRTSFVGVQGNVSFEMDTGGRAPTYSVDIVHAPRGSGGVSFERIGTYSFSNGGFRMTNPLPSPWLTSNGGSGGPVQDRARVETRVVDLHETLVIVVQTACAIALAVTIFTIFFNIRYRNTYSVRMSSPKINVLSSLGLVVLIVGVLVSAYEHSDDAGVAPCKASWALFVLGFSVALGALFSKVYRVHVIFNQAVLQQKARLHDRDLFLGVALLLLADLVILAVWYSAAGEWHNDRIIVSAPDVLSGSATGNVVYEEVVVVCDPPAAAEFTFVFVSSKTLVLLFGAYLAYSTRHVNIEALNDAKAVGTVIYTVVLVCLVAVPALLSVSDSDIETRFMVMAIAIVFVSLASAVMLYAPKMVAVRGLSRGNSSTRKSGAGGGRASSESSLFSSHHSSRNSALFDAQLDDPENWTMLFDHEFRLQYATESCRWLFPVLSASNIQPSSPSSGWSSSQQWTAPIWSDVFPETVPLPDTFQVWRLELNGVLFRASKHTTGSGTGTGGHPQYVVILRRSVPREKSLLRKHSNASSSGATADAAAAGDRAVTTEGGGLLILKARSPSTSRSSGRRDGGGAVGAVTVDIVAAQASHRSTKKPDRRKIVPVDVMRGVYDEN